jgi:polyketide biosynthesis enoyl-CoA hydratase PksI
LSNVVVTTPAEGIFRLALDDVENGNRLSDELCADLIDGLARVAAEPALKVLILTGGHDVFSGGASLATLQHLSAGASSVKDLALPAQLIGFPVPVIAALEGDAVGGGLMLAICCDILVAADNRRFGLNFTTLGFSPGMGATGLVPALVGHGLAMEMFLTGKFYKGRELIGRGLFNAVVPQERVQDVALDYAARIAERPRYVIEMVKATLAAPRLRILNEALEREHVLHQRCFARPDIGATIEHSY